MVLLSKLILEITSKDAYEKFYKDIDPQIYTALVTADPTYSQEKDIMGKYSKWILNLWKRKAVKEEDIYKFREYLSVFDKYKNRMEKKDINQYKSLPDLAVAIEPFENSGEPESKSAEIRNIKKEAKKVYEDSDWVVIVPETEEASCYYGKGTKWCTAAEHNNYFNNYSRQGPLYININKHSGRKYQFHFESDQFMNEKDNGINIFHDLDDSEGLLAFYRDQGKISFEMALKNGAEYEWLEDLYDSNEASESLYYDAINAYNEYYAYRIWFDMPESDVKFVGTEVLEQLRDEIENGDYEDLKRVLFRLAESGVDVVNSNSVSKIYYRRGEEYDNLFDFAQNKLKAGDFRDFLLAADIDPDDYSDIFHRIEELDKYKQEDGTYKLENKNVLISIDKMKEVEDSDDEEKNGVKYYVNITFKKSKKNYKGWISSDKLFSYLTQYDLFDTED